MWRKCWALMKSAYNATTVEPAYFIFSFSLGLYGIVVGELYISKVCKVNLAFGEEVCENLQQPEYNEQQIAVQKYVSQLNIYNSVLQAVPSVLFALFAGPWSDTNGRKFILLFSLFGFAINNVVFLINSYWFYELKAEYLLFEALQDCTGGIVCFFMAVASYLTDVTEAKHRAKRFGLTSGLFTVGTNIGKALAGPIKVHLGFIYNFIFGLVVTLVAMGYVYFIVPDSFKVREARLKKEREENGQSNAKELVDLSSLSVTEKFRTLFQVKNLKAGATALLRKRDNNMRFYLILMVVCFELEMFLSIGNYLYLRRVLDFTLLDLTRLHTFGGVVALFSQFIMIPILSEKLKLHDSTIVLIDTGTNFIRTLILIFVQAHWMLYLGTCIAFLNATSFAVIRCMITKQISPHEVGCLMSVVSGIQAFVPFVKGPLFGLIYRNTVEYLPQTCLIVVAVGIFIDWMLLYTINRGVRRVEKKKEKALELANAEKKNFKECTT